MTAADAISTVIPAVGLLVLALPGEPIWTRRPWFTNHAPDRRMLALILGVLLIVALVHVLA
jgi:hypothetical protein